MFEQNNVGVRLENPIMKYVDGLVTQHRAGCGQEAALRHVLACMEAIALKVEAEAEEEENEMDLCEVIGQDMRVEGDEEEVSADMMVSSSSDGVETAPSATLGSAEEVIERIEALIEEYSAESMFPPLDGTSFYKTVCKINHSCEPNVRVQYVVSVSGLVVDMLALQRNSSSPISIKMPVSSTNISNACENLVVFVFSLTWFIVCM